MNNCDWWNIYSFSSSHLLCSHLWKLLWIRKGFQIHLKNRNGDQINSVWTWKQSRYIFFWFSVLQFKYSKYSNHQVYVICFIFVIETKRDKINLIFYFCTSLWCLKRFYEAPYEVPNLWGTIKKCENKS